MRARIFTVILVGAVVISAVIATKLVAAKPDNPSEGKKPQKAPRPEKLTQIIFVHPVAPEKPGSPGKPDKPPKPKPEEPKENSYYELWGGYLDNTLPAVYHINPAVGLVTAGDPVAAVNSAVEAWDTVTAEDVFDYAGTTEKNWYEQDDENTISWVKFIPRDYIAIAVMWYDENMEIWEFDIVFNTFHRWGIDPAKGDRAFDIQNIATHEFGHPVGLADLYDEPYSELTMYGYSSKGETKKCSLEEGDISGAQELYRTP